MSKLALGLMLSAASSFTLPATAAPGGRDGSELCISCRYDRARCQHDAFSA
jgi:hypothetical protein